MRNRLLLLLAATATAGTSFGQFETGKKLLSGSISFNTNSTQVNSTVPNTTRNSYFSTGLSISRFSSPLSLKGFGLNYSYSHSLANFSTVPEERTNTHTVGAFITRTKLQPLGSRFYLAFEGTLGASYSSGRTSYQNSPNYSKTSGYQANISGSLGVWYQLNQRFILSGGLSNLFYVNYNHNKRDTYNAGGSTSSSRSNGFGIGTGLNGFSLNSFSIGLRYALKK